MVASGAGPGGDRIEAGKVYKVEREPAGEPLVLARSSSVKNLIAPEALSSEVAVDVALLSPGVESEWWKSEVVAQRARTATATAANDAAPSPPASVGGLSLADIEAEMESLRGGTSSSGGGRRGVPAESDVRPAPPMPLDDVARAAVEVGPEAIPEAPRPVASAGDIDIPSGGGDGDHHDLSLADISAELSALRADTRATMEDTMLEAASKAVAGGMVPASAAAAGGEAAVEVDHTPVAVADDPSQGSGVSPVASAGIPPDWEAMYRAERKARLALEKEV